MQRKRETMDGNTAAAYVAYAFSDAAAIYPITPSSPMAEITDVWASGGRKNLFGDTVKVVEMQSEAGAAGTLHGALASGALTTTFTASQGLLLMIPNMYKIAGEGLPCVIHVSARTVATHALSIFGDHSDIYACRQCGFAMLAENDVQEIMDLAAAAHIATLEGGVPVLNFFDGFRTSHEIQKIEKWDYEDLDKLLDKEAVKAFRHHALSPETPAVRGSHENPDVYFQHREACNKKYLDFPDVMQMCMDRINALIGTDYRLFNYYGAPDAERVIIAMGSVCSTAEQAIDILAEKGEKVGLIKVRLYRPFSVKHFAQAIPKTCKKIAVLDRTKEPGAVGEPLYTDVTSALYQSGITNITVVGGRYGLSSKDTPISSLLAVYEELKSDTPKNSFTIGINDDMTNLSLPEGEAVAEKGVFACKFFGLGGDGTVGANKNSVKIVGNNTDKYVQAYFQYDSKKTGGITISHLRFSDKKIKSPYYVKKADFVACHNPSYIDKGYKMAEYLKRGGTFLVNCNWNESELSEHLSSKAKRYIAQNDIKVYTVDALGIAEKIGMGRRINTVLQAVFFALTDIIPLDKAKEYMKEAAYKSYSAKGDEVVNANYAAIDEGAFAYRKVNVPLDWLNATDDDDKIRVSGKSGTVKMVKKLLEPIALLKGDTLPVSAFKDYADGQFMSGASAFEKRGVAVTVPKWVPENCIQCGTCSFVCPHATIRTFLLDEQEVQGAPSGLEFVSAKGKGLEEYKFSVSVSPLDCMGCMVCLNACPANKAGRPALEQVSQESQISRQAAFEYAVSTVKKKETTLPAGSVKGSQLNRPLLEFPGSCAGCAETAYARLITQLFGERMYISNATGCSSIWGAPAAASAYTFTAEGRGPAWSNSLFEDNAEHGLGIYLGQKILRDRLIDAVAKRNDLSMAEEYLSTLDDGRANDTATKKLVAELERAEGTELLVENKKWLSKKSVWIFGGDGWAYDIGYGGLDHVLASGADVNIFVFDTEVYSNTGGQASKATNKGAVAQFAVLGKESRKKSLAEMAMSYGNVYVAQIAMGADMNQTLKALIAAENYKGTSLIIAYSPCEMHGIKGGMSNSMLEMKKAVDCGYWHLFRYDPLGSPKFVIDSKEPKASYEEFMEGETRYSRLERFSPERAKKLFDSAAKESKERYEHLKKLENLYN